MDSTQVATSSLPLSSNDRLWSVLCHLSSFFGVTFIFPLIVYLVMRKDSPYVADHAREALNFHISILIYVIVSCLLIFVVVGIPMLIAVALFSLICSIIAAVKASDGIVYRYPLTIRLVS